VFGVQGVVGKKALAKKPNRVSATDKRARAQVRSTSPGRISSCLGHLTAPASARAPDGARGALKRPQKTTYLVLPTYLFLRCFEIFRSDLRKKTSGVFGLLMQRNGQKDEKKSKGKDDRIFFFSTFSARSF
jgi:hypothetical protein